MPRAERRTGRPRERGRQAAPGIAAALGLAALAGLLGVAAPACGVVGTGSPDPPEGRAGGQGPGLDPDRRGEAASSGGGAGASGRVGEVIRWRLSEAHASPPRVGVGDLSRRRGGDFGIRYGAPGHASHQNGLDVDVYYPRLDRRERPPRKPSQVDLRLAEELVDWFVDAGAEKVFVGPRPTDPCGAAARRP